MDLETLKKNKDFLAAQMAYYSAANAVTLGEATGSLNWPFLGEDRGFEVLGDAMFDYSKFVRANPTAPAEALFRFGAGREHHARDGATWSDVEFVWRSAFTVFHRTLPIFDELIAAEIAALESAEFRKRMAPTLAALSLPEEDTILERFGTIFETSPNLVLQPVTLRLDAESSDLGVEITARTGEAADQANDTGAAEVTPTGDQAGASSVDAGAAEPSATVDQADTTSTDAGATETATIADQASASSADAGAAEPSATVDQANTTSTDAGATETATIADQADASSTDTGAEKTDQAKEQPTA